MLRNATPPLMIKALAWTPMTKQRLQRQIMKSEWKAVEALISPKKHVTFSSLKEPLTFFNSKSKRDLLQPPEHSVHPSHDEQDKEPVRSVGAWLKGNPEWDTVISLLLFKRSCFLSPLHPSQKLYSSNDGREKTGIGLSFQNKPNYHNIRLAGVQSIEDKVMKLYT